MVRKDTDKPAIKKVIYATEERKALINRKNIVEYDKYLKSRISRNSDTKNTTYKQYKSSFYIWLCFLAERYDNPFILDIKFLDDVFMDMMDDYIYFLQDELGNNKKRINFHCSAISSFYIFAVKRRLVRFNPMQNVSRMERANDEHIIDSDFLKKYEVQEITSELMKTINEDYTGHYDIIDLIIWKVFLDSTSRISAVHQLTLDNLQYDEARHFAYFDNIREKRGKITKVVIRKDTYDLIMEHYIPWREKNNINTNDLFPAKNGVDENGNATWSQMTKESIYRRVRKIGNIVGLTGFRPHSIRKTSANLLYKEHGIEATQQILLHESSDTTMKHYIEKTGVDDVFAKILSEENNNNESE